MNLFRYDPAQTTYLYYATPIDNFTSVMWVERYRTPGEFKITAPLSSGLKERLPLGTFISHDGTYEVMVVENHQLVDDPNEDTVLEITGRSFESLLEQRIVGCNQVWSAHSGIKSEYLLSAEWTFLQAQRLIRNHIYTSWLVDTGDALTQVRCEVGDIAATVAEARVVPNTNLHQQVMSLLAFGDCGIRTIRHNNFPFGHPSSDDYWQTLLIHSGNDLRDEIIFSEQAGDVSSADYLWSDKDLKTSAFISGTYLESRYDPAGAPSAVGRRMMLVNASDIDEGMTEAELASSAAIAAMLVKFDTRAKEALANHNEVQITRADISPNSQYRYRTHYDVGDIVTVDGNFGAVETMRVIEYVEIQDENGGSGHPTLQILEE